METELHHRDEDGRSMPFLVWRLPPATRLLSSGPVGGGLGPRAWVLNAQVRAGYDRVDLAAHVGELAEVAGLPPGPGAGLLTAAEVREATTAEVDEVSVVATVGLGQPEWAAGPGQPEWAAGPGQPEWAAGPGQPEWAAAPPGAVNPFRPGTINVVVWVPVALTDAALVNAVITATEAKTQALVEAAIPGSGTATDAVAVICPEPSGAGPTEAFAGPRAPWGSRLARAVHRAVADGIPGSLAHVAAATAARAQDPRS